MLGVISENNKIQTIIPILFFRIDIVVGCLKYYKHALYML